MQSNLALKNVEVKMPTITDVSPPDKKDKDDWGHRHDYRLFFYYISLGSAPHYPKFDLWKSSLVGIDMEIMGHELGYGLRDFFMTSIIHNDNLGAVHEMFFPEDMKNGVFSRQKKSCESDLFNRLKNIIKDKKPLIFYQIPSDLDESRTYDLHEDFDWENYLIKNNASLDSTLHELIIKGNRQFAGFNVLDIFIREEPAEILEKYGQVL